MDICPHRYPVGKCWKCDPYILEKLHKAYEKNMPIFREYADKYPAQLMEFYQDINAIGSYDIDWDMIFQVCRETEEKQQWIKSWKTSLEH